MVTRVEEMTSPVDSSMSISRASGRAVICPASSMSSSVVSPMAETTTTMRFPAAAALRHPLGDGFDAIGILDGASSVLLDDERH